MLPAAPPALDVHLPPTHPPTCKNSFTVLAPGMPFRSSNTLQAQVVAPWMTPRYTLPLQHN